MQNNLEAPISMTELHTMFAKEIKGLQQVFVDAFARQEAWYYKTIESLKKEIEEIY